MQTVKNAGIALWLLGIAGAIGLIVWSGIGAVGQAIAGVGWGLLLVIGVRAVALIVAASGWRVLFPAKCHPSLRLCVLLRFVRAAANDLLPVAQVGGDIIGARLLSFRSVPGALAAASVIVDVLIQAATQVLFAILGLLLLMSFGADGLLVRTAAIGLAIAALMLGAFYVAQRHWGQRILRWAISRITSDRKWSVLGTVDLVYRWLTAIYSSRSALFASSAVHFVGWLIGTAEVLVVFHFLGEPIGIAEALIIESLLHAIRGAVFALPGALGVQEAGLIVLCGAFDIPPDQAIALSLIKRAADLVLGVPPLLWWHMHEWGRFTPGYSDDKQLQREPVDYRSQRR